MIKLTYFRNHTTRQTIVQLSIDDEDLIIPTTIERPGLRVVDQLAYLTDLVQSIELQREGEKSMFEDIMQPEPPIDPPPIDEEPEDEELEDYDEENMDEDDRDKLDEDMDEFPDDDDYIPTIDDPDEP